MTGLVGDYLRPTKQQFKLTPNPTIRNRAFAATRSDVTVGTAATSSSIVGGVFRPPTEQRTSNVRAYQSSTALNSPTSDQTESVVKSYGYNGDTTMTLSSPQPGAQLLRKEFDIESTDAAPKFEFMVAGNGALTRVWVNEQPTTSKCVDQMSGASDGNTRWIPVTLPGPGYYRIMIEAENSFIRFRGIVHGANDKLHWPQLRSRGRLMFVADSIGEMVHANDGSVYRSGNWQINAGQLLGLHDVIQGYNQGGTGLVNVAGTGSRPFGDRIAQDVVPLAPDALVVVCSSNDASNLTIAGQVSAALQQYVSDVRDVLPDCQIIGLGPVAVPWVYGGTNMQEVYAQFQAGCAAAGIEFLDTKGVFTGKTYPGGTDPNTSAGYGNSDLFASTHSSQLNTPHPNQAGHDHIARFVAPKLARALGIDLSVLPGGPTTVTPSGYWES